MSLEETGTALQLTMFTPLSQRVLDRLEETEIDRLTPLQALNLLEELKSEIGSGKMSGGKIGGKIGNKGTAS